MPTGARDYRFPRVASGNRRDAALRRAHGSRASPHVLCTPHGARAAHGKRRLARCIDLTCYLASDSSTGRYRHQAAGQRQSTDGAATDCGDGNVRFGSLARR